MEMHYPTIDQPATAEFVLAILRDMHRQQCEYDPAADPDASLSFDSTVAEWREACDLLGWRELGRAYNQFWEINCSDAEWKEVLEPAQKKRLAGVCELLAQHASRPMIRPARSFGSACNTAGAFLTIRSMLHGAGAQAEAIAPSTPLAPYTRRYFELFLGPISRLAPGALPLVRIRHPVYGAYNAAILGMMAAAVGIMVSTCTGLHLLTIACVLLFALAYSMNWIAARRMLPASVEFGELRTFRELAIVVSIGSTAPPDRGGK